MCKFPKHKVYGPKEFADRARATVKAYKDEISNKSGEDDETCVLDLLTDLRHFCKEEKIDFAKCLRISRYHAKEEEAECTDTSQSPT